MIHRWLVAAILFVTFGCGLGEYSPPVTVLRDDGDPASTSGDDSPGDPVTGDPVTGDPGSGDPLPGDPLPGDPLPGDPLPGDPLPGDPLPGDPLPGDPLPGDPLPGDPYVPPQSIQLNVDPVVTGDVSRFEVTPDGTKVVYLSDEETDDKWELFAVDIDGQNRVRINGVFPSTGDAVEFAISPNSQKVVYRADQRVNDHYELYASNIDGTGNVQLHPDLATNRVIVKWAISANRVVYRCDQEDNNTFELFSTQLDGTQNVKLNNTLVSNGDVLKFMMSPDHSLVVYWADEVTDARNELWAVNPDGTANRRVHEPLTGALDAGETYFISPDNLKVAFRGALTTVGFQDIYVATLDTPPAVRVSADLPDENATTREVYWTPDSTRVVYRSDHDTDEAWELFSVLANGTGRAKLHPALPSGHATGTVGFVPNSSKILYTADLDQLAVFELYAINPDGTGRVKLNSDFALGQNIVRFAAAADSSRVVYLANEGDVGQLDLFSVTPTGTDRIRLTDFGAGGNVYNFRTTADSSRVVFTADGDLDGIIELYAVALDGTGLVRLNDAMVGGSYVADFRIANTNVAYLADQDTPGVRELYAKNGLTTPGGATSSVGASPSLVDVGLLARYFLDEAIAGRTPASAADAAPSPLNLPITWDPNMAYLAGPGGAGLQWQRVDSPGTPTINIDGTKFQSLNGSTTGTLEVVVDIDHDTESEPRFVYFGTGGSFRGFCLLYDGPRKRVKFWFDYTVNPNAMWWGLDLLGAGRHVLTAVVDSGDSTEMNRVVLFVDGVRLPAFREVAEASPAQNATLSLVSTDATPVIYDFYIGNRANGERSNDGRIYYAAVYDAALDDDQVFQNASILLHNDDTP